MGTNASARRETRSRSLSRTILSLAVAAVIAASIPFAAIYAGTLQRPPAVAALTSGSSSGARQILVTTASGRQVAVPASGQGAATASAAPVRTRTSGAVGSD
jgi:hypothetical protein